MQKGGWGGGIKDMPLLKPKVDLSFYYDHFKHDSPPNTDTRYEGDTSAELLRPHLCGMWD